MQRHTALTIPLAACNLGSIQATRTHDLDALGTEAHSVLHRALHSASEHDAFLELLGNRICNQLRIGLRLADFFDIDMNLNAQNFLQADLQLFDILTFLADHHARASGIHSDAGILGGSLDHDAAN